MADWQMTHSVLRFVEFETESDGVPAVVAVQPTHVIAVEPAPAATGYAYLVMSTGPRYRVVGGPAEVLRRLLGVDI